ncbi:hypothetical protein [Streptomyces sp. NPDC001401]|uniref:hypothetical protein n=1 Tax=Streptomyces sp. NPDC001401 TaxID=3364570 RepID=UPI00367FC1F2
MMRIRPAPSIAAASVIATLYRRFPDREALVQQVVLDRLTTVTVTEAARRPDATHMDLITIGALATRHVHIFVDGLRPNGARPSTADDKKLRSRFLLTAASSLRC